MSETLLAVAISFVLTLLIGRFLIPELRKLKAGQEIRAEELAERCGTITNELLSRLGSRLAWREP